MLKYLVGLLDLLIFHKIKKHMSKSEGIKKRRIVNIDILCMFDTNPQSA